MNNMKQLGYLLLLFLVLGATSCNSEKQKMEVVKDCTGVYLRSKSGLDYKVCNESMLDNYAAGTKLKVTYDLMEECFGLLEPPTCSDSHLTEGVIEITKIY